MQSAKHKLAVLRSFRLPEVCFVIVRFSRVVHVYHLKQPHIPSFSNSNSCWYYFVLIFFFWEERGCQSGNIPC